MLLLFALIVGSGTAWADVVSGTTYSTPSTSNLPDGWSGDGSGTSYVQLTSSSNYIQTSSFAQNGFTSIVVKARTYGGPSAEQAVITVSWYSDENETVLGTISPSSKTLTNYTISSPNNPTGNTTGYIKIQCKGASSSKGSGVSEVTINYTAASGGSTTYTVTYDGNGATSGDVPEDNNEYEEDDEVTVLSNTGSLAKTGYSFGGWNTQNDGQGTNYTAGNTFTISSNTTLYAKWIQNPYTVTLGDDNSTLTEVSGGAGVTLPSRSAIGSYTFAGWSETNVTSETTTAPTIISAGSYNPTSNITLFPVYTKTEGGGGSQNNTASVSIATYASDNSWVSGNSSGPQYTEVELNSDITATTTGTGNNGKYYSSDYSWRFYTNGSGNVIISTTAGTLSSVTLTYSGGFTYGGNAITSGNAVNVSGTSAEFTCTSNAKITAIEVNYTTTGGGTTYYWSSPVAATVERPEITIAENPFYFNTTATITCETTGATIYYTTDGSDPTTSSNVYSAAIPLTATTTIKAFAVLGSDESTIASVTATKNLATPTVTVSGDLTLDLDGGTDVNAGTLTAAVTYNDAAVAGATVTWSSSDTDVATIDENTGAVTILTTGTVTFTATYAGNSDYAEATGTKTVTVVDSNVPGATAENPYTVAQARYAIDNSGTTSNVYVRGIVCTGGSSLSSGAMNYWISDDGTQTDKFEIYRGKGISNANFTSTDDIQVGDVVVVYGNIVLYSNTTYEFSAGSQLVSLFRKADNTIAVTGGNEFTINRNNSESSLTFAATAASGTTVSYAIDATNTTLDAADYNLTGSTLTVTGTSAGTITITASAAGTSEYKDGEATITITVFGVKDDPTIVVNASEIVSYGSTFTVDDSMIEGGDITVTSGNTAVATVSGLVITPAAVGTTTITVATAANDFYNAGSETFELTVTAPVGKTTAAPSTSTIFSETFDDCEGTGGNDDSWSGSIASGALNADNSGWVFTNGSGASECAKFGTGSKKGSATTPALGTTGTLELSFRAAAWNGTSEGTTLNLSVSEGSISVSSVTLTKAEFNTFTATITNATAATTITFEAQNASNNRFFLDDVVVTKAGEAITATLNGNGYATYCSEYPLDFSEATDYTAWQITSANSSTNEIIFEKVTGSVKGGTGLFLMGTPNTSITLTSVNSTNELDDNMLVGTLAPTYFETEAIYGLRGNQFLKNGVNVFPANKAYIDGNDVSGSVKDFVFIFSDETTGVERIEKQVDNAASAIYDLSGRRVQSAKRGLYIVNGKKMFVK